MKKIIYFLFLIFLSTNVSTAAMEKIFYLTNDSIGNQYLSDKKLEFISKHSKDINILAPQNYELNARGDVWGSLDPGLLQLAKASNVRIMPLILNSGFDQEIFHNFIHDDKAQAHAIDQMIKLSQNNNFYGWQFDFENISSQDRDAYTQFIKHTAEKFHQNKLQLSVAVVPRASEVTITDYDRWVFDNWSGGYDYRAIGQYADFITLMSYDNHTSLTTPGPIAPYNWVEKTLKLVLEVVPANKISLGLPAYSGYFFTGKITATPEKLSYRSKELQVSYKNIASLINKYSANVIWNSDWQSSYAIYTNDDKLEYLFIEDATSFRAKLVLIQKYHLRGFSIWKLGLEDPAIWGKKE